MSVKKKSIEEKMAKSIFYNLSILKMSVKTTPQFDESLSETMFLKSNTQAFIHITHFLFNILDAKEFKSKFYWPIPEKKAENSYRSSAVDFINNIISKHNLAQEKVKLVFVVHPFGKKFMSLILDLVILATKEIMKRRGIPGGKSFDIDKVTKVVTDMKEVENNLVKSINLEIKVVKSKTIEIRELMKEIFPPEDFPMSFGELIKSWHDMNIVLITNIRARDKRIDSVYTRSAELQESARIMLSPKVFDVKLPPLEVITEVAEFYKNAGLVVNEDKKADLNFPWLISQLHLVFPAIVNYVSNFSLDSSDNKESELKELNRLFNELVKIEKKTKKFSAVFKKKIPEMIAKLTIAKEKRQKIEEGDQTMNDQTEKTASLEIEMDKLSGLSTPKNFFDVSKNCLKQLVVNKNRMPLFEDERDEKENVANETKLYRSIKSPYMKNSKMNQSVMVAMAPPKQNPRRRLDPMALLEQATSNGLRNRQELNATTRYTGAIPKIARSAPKFSSTLLSPDLRQPVFNCSVVSVIAKGSPVIDSPDNFSSASRKNINTPSVSYNRDSIDPIAPFEKSLEMSPKGKLSPLVRHQDSFINAPKLELNDKTLSESTDTSSATIVNQNSAHPSENPSESFSFGSVRMTDDENLFNISDSILKEIDD